MSKRLANKLHQVREIGNFAAHPSKDSETGAIVDVEPGEAEFNLEIVEELFEFYYTEPARDAESKAKINEKLVAVGKPEIK